MASCQTSQWVNTAPYVKLTVTEESSTGYSVDFKWTLQYVASYAANTSVKKEYSVKIGDSLLSSGTYDIDGKTGTHTIASGTKGYMRGHEERSIEFECSFGFNMSWSGVYKGTSSAKGSITVGEKAKYTVSYDANGGSGAPSAQTKWHNETLTLQSGKPTLTGHTFQGWATSKGGSVAYQPGDKYTVDADLHLFAVWKAKTYSVTYNANGGTGAPAAQVKTHGQTLTLSSIKPTRENYNFVGWALSANSTTVSFYPGTPFAGNAAVNLFAVWELAYNKPRITDISIMRVDSSGIADDSGKIVVVSFRYDCDLGDNVVNVYCKKSNVAGWDDIIPCDIRPGDDWEPKTVEFVWQNLSDEFSYTFQIYVADSNDSTVVIRSLPAASLAIDFKPPTEETPAGVAIGKPAELNGVLDIALETLVRGGFRNFALEPNTDLNDVKTPNTYIGANISTYEYSNCPLTSGTFTLTVESAGEEGQIKQILTRCSKTEPERYIRFYYQSEWSAWMPDVSAVVYVKTANTDLNDYLQTGVWYFNTSHTPNNLPTDCVNGWLVVLRADSGAIKQFWLRYGSMNTNDFNTYVRTSNGSAWSGWSRFAVEPKVLFDGSTDGTVTLLETAANFAYLEIIYSDNNGKQGGFAKIDSPNGVTFCASLIEASTASVTYIRRTAYTISGTSITPNTTTAAYHSLSGSSVVHKSGNYIKILKVLGHRA